MSIKLPHAPASSDRALTDPYDVLIAARDVARDLVRMLCVGAHNLGLLKFSEYSCHGHRWIRTEQPL